MSRIGKLPVQIPSGVDVKIEGNKVVVKGSKGELNMTFEPDISVKIEDGYIIVTRKNDEKHSKSLHGLTRALIANLIEGVTQGFKKELEIIGVGYKAEGGGKQITLHLGFSHPVKLNAPDGVNIELDKERKNIVVISGLDKQKVGQFASEIREFRKPEPYKGKGIRYVGERVPLKAGKKAAAK